MDQLIRYAYNAGDILYSVGNIDIHLIADEHI